ncbi:hypothetical protein F5Y16DRAFT_325901 [Xylariaceae sp. FL0255]|nr:hypothetical protein F5Y16DRAFT_325901 [Xylariaceae sp. FL0255]
MDTYYLYDQEFWFRNIVQAPLNKRGWVLQERMLSPRILHFTDTQLFWECFQQQACETWPHGLLGLDLKTHDGPERLPCKQQNKSKSEDEKKDSLRKLHKQWRLLAETYSKCGLTVQTDKLVAISALARRFATYFEDDYIAGMWRLSLENDLVWIKNVPDPDPPPTAPYVAPSWSWMSASGISGVRMSGGLNGTSGGYSVAGWPNDGETEHFACVEDVQLDYMYNGDPFGALKGGRLRLRGTLQQVQLIPRLNLPTDELPMEKLVGIIEKRSSRANHMAVINGIPVVPTYSLHRKFPVFHIFMDRNPFKRFDEENREGVLFCMLVYRYKQVGLPWYFLLLQVVNAADGIFRRLGVLDLYPEESETCDIKRAALSRHKEQENFPCVEYRVEKHSIWIV